MTGWIKWAIALAIAAVVASATAPSIAQGTSSVAMQRLGPPDVEARRESLLKQMLARPNDLDLAFEYATLSSQVGDYEGAISTLERMLIYAPNTPRLQLELGVLYYRIGAYEVARSYFAQALANPKIPPEIANQIKLYLQQLALTADPPPFSATIFSAIRWESNANAGPRHAERDAERHRLHHRPAIGRQTRLERAQYRHAALQLESQARRPHRARRARLLDRLFREPAAGCEPRLLRDSRSGRAST